MTFFFGSAGILAYTDISLSLDLEGEKTYSAPIQSNILSFLRPMQLRYPGGEGRPYSLCFIL